MFKRQIHGKDVVYYRGNKIAAAVVAGEQCKQLYPNNHNLHSDLRYLVISSVGCADLKAKHLDKLTNIAKGRDGIACSMVDESIQFVLNGRVVTATYEPANV